MKRKDRLQAKGKGVVQTYWVKSKVSKIVEGESGSGSMERNSSNGSVVSPELDFPERLPSNVNHVR